MRAGDKLAFFLERMIENLRYIGGCRMNDVFDPFGFGSCLTFSNGFA